MCFCVEKEVVANHYAIFCLDGTSRKQMLGLV